MDNVIYSAMEYRENEGRWSSGVLSGPAEEKTADPVFMEGVLPQEEFLERLRFEKRRVDRVGNPLSMTLFFLKEELLADVKKLREFLASIKQGTRETDLKGWVKRNIFGLLLLDTDGPRAQKCLELLVNGRTKTVCDVVTVTYPDRLFHEILEKAEAEAGILSLESLETVGGVTVSQVLKRLLDILGSLIGLICFSPVMLITAIAIKLTSPGPIIFRQARLGLRGNHFDLMRFRVRAAGNDDWEHREYVFNPISGKYDQFNQGTRENPLYNLKNDNRISPVVNIIRKLGLDQLPQFLNVLKGEMSLVGPRPPIPHEVEKFKSWHLRRILSVKPGITGLWQVEGRSPSSLDEMIRLDLRYVQNWSLWLDFKILGKTALERLMPQGSKRRPNPNDVSSNGAGGFKKIWKASKVIVQGTAVGFGLNYYWHYFLAVNLGWGDSAPDWYFRLQEIIFLGIMLIGLIGWMFFYPRVRFKSKRISL